MPDLGGGGSQPTQQQIATTELPEWAKPYAQKTLAKAESLTDQPYKTYDNPRIAGFSPLQQAAMSTVESPEAYGRSIGTFMSPYMQNVVDVQKREAARQSNIMGAQQQAQATGAGAFGGYRDAIQRAERERNLGQQMNDIQARGSEAAYQGAQGTLGNFLNLQSQYGGQQQALRQQGLTQSYQDFLNEQNYPYKQLGFMSDLIRGLPLGQQSASQIYQAPGSISGQIAGLGMGMYGMSRAFPGMFAEGGSVDEYAEGGVTDDRNVEEILSKLSDAQLAQAKQAAVNAQDQMQIQMIDAEMAQRASMRRGLGSIPVDFAAFMPDEQSMARGGIVAFADEGLVEEPEEATSTVGDFFRSIGRGISSGVEKTAQYGKLRSQADEARPGLFEALTPTERKQRTEKVKDLNKQIAALTGSEPSQKKESAPIKVTPNETDKAIIEKLSVGEKDSSPAPKAPAKSISEAARIVTDVAKTEVPKDDVRELSRSILAELNSAPRPEAEALSRMLDKAEKRAEDIKARSVGDALMKFGFGMAAGAAKPGQARRAGLAGALESAAAASPLFAESMAESEKLQNAAEDNALKLRLENARYKSAVEQGNKQLAASLAGSISQRNLQQAELQEKIEQNARMNALKEKEIAGISAYRQSMTDPQQVKIAERYMQENPGMTFNEAMETAAKVSAGGIRADMTGVNQAMKLKQDLEKQRRLWAGSNSEYAKNQIADIDRQINGINQQYGLNKGTGVGSGAGQVLRFDAKGNPI